MKEFIFIGRYEILSKVRDYVPHLEKANSNWSNQKNNKNINHFLPGSLDSDLLTDKENVLFPRGKSRGQTKLRY